jgi:pimeloyl-ACP methyl ester carboxylesterase
MFVTGCARMLGEQMVRAPNRFDPAAHRADAPPEELHRLYVDRQLRIPVGPPDASISVWVFNPYRGPEWFKLTGNGRRVGIELHRKPATSPTTASADPRGTIFILHGIQDEKELGPYVMFREMLVHEGYRVIQLDFRGHGRSTGDWITYGAVERHDLVQVLDALESQHLIVGNVGVIGISYGGAIAIQWAAIDPRVRAIVAIEPFTTLREIAHDGAGFVLGPARSLFSDGDINHCVDLAGQFASFNPDDADTLSAIAQTRAPILLIHSRDDQFIPYHESERLHSAATDHSKLILVDGSSHFDIWLKSFEVIRTESLDWFAAHLPGPTTQATAEARNRGDGRGEFN